MRNRQHGPDPGRRAFLRGAVALAGGYSLARIFSPDLAFADYKEKAVASPAKLTGKLTFEGAVPKAIMRDVTSDLQVAGKEPRVWEGLNIGTDKGLKDSIVVVNGVFEGKALEMKAPLTFTKGAAILPRIEVFGWKPDMKISLENQDPILHSWQVYVKGEVKDNKAHPTKMPPVELALPDPGLYEMRCAPHNWERAFRWAVQHPYFTKTDADGQFEIAGLPEGDYTVDIWSEGLRPKRLWLPVHDDKVVLERAFGAEDLTKTMKGQ